jgi:hypothetical protein
MFTTLLLIPPFITFSTFAPVLSFDFNDLCEPHLLFLIASRFLIDVALQSVLGTAYMEDFTCLKHSKASFR